MPSTPTYDSFSTSPYQSDRAHVESNYTPSAVHSKSTPFIEPTPERLIVQEPEPIIAALQPNPAVVEKQEDFSPSAVKVEQPVVFKEPSKPERPKKKHAPKPSFKLPKGDPGSDIIPADIASRGDVVIRRYHLSQLSKYLLTADDDYENISKSKHGSSFVFVGVYRILRVIDMFCRAAKSMRHKNRYGDILPYDDTRVHISTSEADHDEFANYINANFVTFPTKADPFLFICSQGPTESTLNDMWFVNLFRLYQSANCFPP